jgi:putative protein-disulfide isomerase
MQTSPLALLKPDVNVILAEGKLLYFSDPICAWSWSITKNIDELKSHFQNKLVFELVLGGKNIGHNAAKWNDSFKDSVLTDWIEAHAKSGQPIALGLFRKEKFVYDSEPPCRAVRVVRDITPDLEFAFYKAIQTRFHIGNDDPNNVTFYLAICEELEIDHNEFSFRFASQKYADLVKEDFIIASRAGISGYPTVVLQINGENHIISHGFSSFRKMSSKISELMA